jgi:hypothetical protein
MKSNLRMLGLALCMLPVWLHAGTGEDLKQTSQAAELIPAGTILPVTLNSTLRSDKSARGATMTLTLMQDIPLGAGKTLRRGSKVTGHVVETVTAGRGSDESKISFQFDGLRFENHTVPITVTLKALASSIEVDAAQIPTGSEDGVSEVPWSLVKIGEDQVRTSPDLSAECRRGSNTNNTPQAFWLFSPDACCAYGFGDLRILQSGRTEPLGEVTLASNRRAVKIEKGSAMLLRVGGSGPEAAQARAIPSQETGQ